MSGPRSRSFDAESLLHSLMENVPGAIYRAANDEIWKVQRVSDEIEADHGPPGVRLRRRIEADDRHRHAS
jgi:hypothetical protein